jgi:KUP system potassium uptake protein
MFSVFQNNPSPSKEDVVGAVSCIIWSLTLVPLFKYCFLVLRAGDDQGEGVLHVRFRLIAGGTFVLYMVLSRFLHLDHHTPNLTTEDSLTLTVTETLDSAVNLNGRPVKGQWIKNSKIAKTALLMWCLFGASAVMADGLLTPAVSVISAVTGNFITFIVYLRRHRRPSS